VDLQRPRLQWWKRQSTSFWAAATLGVPVLLSVALLSGLLIKLIAEGSGAPALGSRLVVVGVVELVLVAVSAWLIRRPSDWTTGAGAAAGITCVFLLAAAWIAT
jgi:hypothetical protein